VRVRTRPLPGNGGTRLDTHRCRIECKVGAGANPIFYCHGVRPRLVDDAVVVVCVTEVVCNFAWNVTAIAAITAIAAVTAVVIATASA
jgi:hypothetical protein